jgi:hypothetical protein
MFCRRGATALSQLRAEDYAQNPFDLAEAIRIEGERDFDRAICRPIDLKQKPFWGELDQLQPEVPSIRVGLVRLDIANATIVVLELALNEEIRPLRRLQVEVSVRVFGIEGNLEDQIVEVSDRHVRGVEVHQLLDLSRPQHIRREKVLELRQASSDRRTPFWSIHCEVAVILGSQYFVFKNGHALKVVKVVSDLLGSEDCADFGDEAWQLPSELWPRYSRLREGEQLLSDQVIQRRHHAMPIPNAACGLALLFPDVLEPALGHAPLM